MRHTISNAIIVLLVIFRFTLAHMWHFEGYTHIMIEEHPFPVLAFGEQIEQVDTLLPGAIVEAALEQGPGYFILVQVIHPDY